jgi:NAD(P)-dependent dehydrogenase (short-subunit alcohol dehydrogenase family)
MPTYFVTGATGFIGRNLVERLLDRDPEAHVYVLVRDGSQERLGILCEKWGAGGRVEAVTGDLLEPRLGVSGEWISEHRGEIDHFFHLAAIYDMTASDRRNEELNVGGTRHMLELVAALEPGTLHHVSSVAVAGSYQGRFTEEMFAEGQELPSPYHRTKYESERLVRERSSVPWRVYRPAIVVGDSRTGEMDKVDGPYYFFGVIRRLGNALPSWLPLVAPEIGEVNMVPVDYVADAMVEIAHQPGLDGRAFHLADPEMIGVTEALNQFARAAGAPQVAVRLDQRLTGALPVGQALASLTSLPGAHAIREAVLEDFGIPDQVIEHAGFTCSFDTAESEHALAGTGISVPPLTDYAPVLWDYWERKMDPDRFKSRSLEAAINGRTVVITGASSGIGRSTALKVAASGGIPIMVARNIEKLEEVREEIEMRGGTASVYSADLADLDSIDGLVEQILADHASVDMIVNNAGRSIRRSVELSLDRFHDFERTMQLNYFGAIKLVMGFIPHMRERRFGHIVNVSSIGVQAAPPRFSAYVASKAALDAWSRVVSSELIGYNITFTTVHMPLVRTPMIAPTTIYKSFPTISPDEAADMICDALRKRPKHINTTLGTVAEVLYAIAPKALDQVLATGYRLFPDSAAAKGEVAAAESEGPSIEQRAMANLTRGVHW